MPEHSHHAGTRYAVGAIDEFVAGQAKLVEVNGRSIGIFRIDDQIIAVLNLCPHAGAPLCRGQVRGTTLSGAPGEFRWGRQGEILACPWHGWEFDLLTGECLTDRRKLHRYPVYIEDGMVYVSLGRK